MKAPTSGMRIQCSAPQKGQWRALTCRSTNSALLVTLSSVMPIDPRPGPSKKSPGHTRAYHHRGTTLMEFQARYPDDDACLEFLWRTRYSPDGEHALCPKRRVERAFSRYQMSNRNTAVLDVHGVWAARAPDSGDDLPQVLHFAAPVVLRDVHHGEHSLWHFCQATGARAGRHVQDRMADVHPDPQRTDDPGRRRPSTGAVEVDEMYVGGRPRLADGARPTLTATGRRLCQNKAPVFGAVERHGPWSKAHVDRATAVAAPHGREDARCTHATGTVRLHRRSPGVYDSLSREGAGTTRPSTTDRRFT